MSLWPLLLDCGMKKKCNVNWKQKQQQNNKEKKVHFIGLKKKNKNGKRKQCKRICECCMMAKNEEKNFVPERMETVFINYC